MRGYNQQLGLFSELDAQVVGMSVDSIYSHIAWQKHEIGTLNFPLASDFWPHGGVARKYDIFREGEPIPGINERAVFLIDKQGKIAFSKVYQLSELPPNEEVLEVLRKLQA